MQRNANLDDFMHVAEALGDLHALRSREGQPLGLVHRDLHPGNVMVADTGAVKLLDIGIAHRVGRLAETRPGTVKARLEYAAPEQLREEPVTGRTDVHGLAQDLFTRQDRSPGGNRAEAQRLSVELPVQAPSAGLFLASDHSFLPKSVSVVGRVHL